VTRTHPRSTPASDRTLFHALTVEEAAHRLGTDPAFGLSASEAAARLREYGPNALPAPRGPSIASLALHQFNSVLIYVLLAAAALSVLLGDQLEFVSILVIAVLNAGLGFFQEFRAEQALRALQALSAPGATVLREGLPTRVPADQVAPGDVLLLEAGDIVPADARVIESISLATAEAPLTGESLPVEKSAEAVDEAADLAERACMVYQGTTVVRGRGRALVVNTGERTEMGRIASLVTTEPRGQTRLQRELSEVGRHLAVVVGGVAVLVFVAGLARGMALDDVLLIAASLAVAAVPEGLPAAATIVLAVGVQRMASRHVIVRRLGSVETLGAVTTIFTDKTGTLTQNRMHVADAWAVADERRLLRAAALCNNAVLSEAGGASGDPTEVALLQYAAARGFGPGEIASRFRRLLEAPFDAARARMSVVVEDMATGERMALMKGAPEVVLERCRWESGESPEAAAARGAAMAEKGMRVLAFAERALAGEADVEEIQSGMQFLGLIGMADPLREEAPAAVRRARKAGIRVVMLTGDQPATARSIGQALGLDGEAVSGREVERLSPQELQGRMASTSVFARVTSDHKLSIIRAARQAGGVIAMTGDGVNDAPALRAADIGVAMGRGGTDVAREAADMVLTDDNFASIVAAVEEGRTIHANIRRFIHFLLSCNAAEVIVVSGALLAAGEAVLTPLQILFVNLVTDGLPALALGVEPAAPGVMSQPPRDPRVGLLTRKSVFTVLVIGCLIAAASLAAFAIGRAWEGDDLATRFAFGTLVGSQLAASIGFRSETQVAARLAPNLWLGGAIALSAAAVLAVFYVPPLQSAFDTSGLSLEQWAAIVGLSLAPVSIVELTKLALTRLRASRRSES